MSFSMDFVLKEPAQNQVAEDHSWQLYKELPRSSQIKIALGAAAVAITVIAAVGAVGTCLTGMGMALAGNPVGLQIGAYSFIGLTAISGVALIGTAIAEKSGIEKALEQAWKEHQRLQADQS